MTGNLSCKNFMNRVINKIIIVLCYWPYVPLAVFYSFVLRAMVEIGGIPSYENPDPKALGFDLHRSLVYTSFDWAFYGSFALLCLVICLQIAGKLMVARKHFLRFGIGMAIALGCIILDPFMKWFAD